MGVGCLEPFVYKWLPPMESALNRTRTVRGGVKEIARRGIDGGRRIEIVSRVKFMYVAAYFRHRFARFHR